MTLGGAVDRGCLDAEAHGNPAGAFEDPLGILPPTAGGRGIGVTY